MADIENPGSFSLVERARVMQQRYKPRRPCAAILYGELADRIEELEAALRTIENALLHDDVTHAWNISRAALAAKEGK